MIRADKAVPLFAWADNKGETSNNSWCYFLTREARLLRVAVRTKYIPSYVNRTTYRLAWKHFRTI